MTVSAADQGKTRECAGATVVLKKLSGKDVSYTYKGDGALLRSARGYDSEGKEIDSSQASAMTMGSTRNSDIQFDKDVDHIKVTVAGGIVEKELPFVLKR